MKANLDTISVSRNGDRAEHVEPIVAENDGNEVPAFEGIERVFKLMQPGKVFGEPVVSGEYTVITASELSMGGGFGMGKSTFMMGNIAPKEGEEVATDAKNATPAFGMGGGGGGGSSARPIALIVIGPDGAKVQPIFDLSKLVLSWMSMWGRLVPSLVKLSMKQKALKVETMPKKEIVPKGARAPKAEKA